MEQAHNSAQLIAIVQEVGFLPLLDSGIRGFSAEDLVTDDCRYVVFSDGGWDWPLWKWKGQMITDGGLVYGKFFAGKAGFISPQWWPDFCNYRRSIHPAPAEGSIDEAILFTLAEHGSLITRELRAACGFNGPKMRSKFDGYVTRLQMASRPSNFCRMLLLVSAILIIYIISGGKVTKNRAHFQIFFTFLLKTFCGIKILCKFAAD